MNPGPTTLSPSEIVGLASPRFAPLPPPPGDRRQRLAAEWELLQGPLIGVGIALFIGAAVLSDGAVTGDDVTLLGLCALVVVACGAYWWWQRFRTLEGRPDLDGIDMVRAFGARVRVDRNELVRQMLLHAFLALEGAGDVELRLEDGVVMVQPLHPDREAPAHWPPGSLERALLRGTLLPVSQIVWDWLADGSNFPWKRAWRLLEHTLARRGLGADDAQTPARRTAAAASASLLATAQAWRSQREPLWLALRGEISYGIGARTVEPTWTDTPNGRIPKYDYREAPLEDTDGALPAEAGAPPPRAERREVMLPPWVLPLLPAGLLAFGAWRASGSGQGVDGWLGWGFGLLLLPIGIGLRWVADVVRARRIAALGGTPSEAETLRRRQRWGVECLWALLPGVVTVAETEWAVLLGLAVLVVFVAAAIGRARPDDATVSAAVARYVQQANAGTPALPPAAPEPPAMAGHLPVVLQTVRADALPEPDMAVAAAFDLPARRGLALARQTRMALITLLPLLAGWPALVSWLDPSADWIWIFGTVSLMIVMVVIAFGGGLKAWTDQALLEDCRKAHAEPSGPRTLLAVLRGWLAFQLPFPLLSAAFAARPGPMWTKPVALALMAFVLLWIVHGLAWRLARENLLRRMPPPAPRRVVMLRVFGSESLHDLRALLAPWYRVGVVDYPEGPDTVGGNEAVREAGYSGRLQDALVKTPEEVQRRLRGNRLPLTDDLSFVSSPFQCTNGVWKLAVLGMLQRADAVVMDLSSFSADRLGSTDELKLLMNHVPLARVTLLVNDSTDQARLREVLQEAADRSPPDSPNRGPQPPVWRLLNIGGLAVRLPGESHADWLRRSDLRLDPLRLCAFVYGAAQSSRDPARRDVVDAAWIRRWAFRGWGVRLLVLAAWLAFMARQARP